MKKNKILTLIMIFAFAFFMIGVRQVNAADGPAENAYIELYKDSEDWAAIYNNGVIDNEAISGATYDKNTNTLTLNNLKSPYELIAYYMGEDFKLNLVGDSEISEIYIDGQYGITNLNIIGTGSLSINKDKKNDSAIAMIDGNIIVDDTVTLRLYAPETIDDCEDCVPFVIGIAYTNIEDGKGLIKFKNGQDINISSEQDWAIAGAETIKGFGLKESSNPRSYTIVEKNNKKYGMYTSETNYI